MTRIKEIDIAKGVGIVLVVFGHLIENFNVQWQGAHSFVYLFHMPLFFFLSGMFFRKDEKFKPFILKKIKRLFIPYVLASILFFSVEMIRACIIGEQYDGNMTWAHLPLSILGKDVIPSVLARPLWFILVLFRVAVIYWLIFKLLKGKRWFLLALTAGIGVAGLVTAPGWYMSGQTLVALPFFCIGHICGTGMLQKENWFGLKPSAIFCVLSIPVLYIVSRLQLTNMSINHYGNAMLFILGAATGIMFTLWLCVLLKRVKPLSDAFSFIGKYTMSIMIWHIFAMLALSKIVGTSGFIPCLLLVIAGVAAPVALSLAWNRIKRIIV